MRKRILTSALLASVLGLGIFATSSFASGPIVIGPAPVPAVPAAPIVNSMPLQMKLLNTYKQVRAFWLSRGIVR
ncbi:MAG: hypothetical protein K8F91_14245 [Candidatus Obscuribacterales bacterium]|nr:hypothetical protein [Candidatus Obscuribacterales bacterium]